MLIVTILDVDTCISLNITAMPLHNMYYLTPNLTENGAPYRYPHVVPMAVSNLLSHFPYRLISLAGKNKTCQSMIGMMRYDGSRA